MATRANIPLDGDEAVASLWCARGQRYLAAMLRLALTGAARSPSGNKHATCGHRKTPENGQYVARRSRLKADRLTVENSADGDELWPRFRVRDGTVCAATAVPFLLSFGLDNAAFQSQRARCSRPMDAQDVALG